MNNQAAILKAAKAFHTSVLALRAARTKIVQARQAMYGAESDMSAAEEINNAARDALLTAARGD